MGKGFLHWLPSLLFIISLNSVRPCEFPGYNRGPIPPSELGSGFSCHLRALTWDPIRNWAPVVAPSLRSSVLLGLFTNSPRPQFLQVSSETLPKLAIILIMVGTRPLGHFRPKISRRHVMADLELFCLLPVLAGHPSSDQTLTADFRGLCSTPAPGHPFSLAWEAAQIPALIILPTQAACAGLLPMRCLMNDAAWMCLEHPALSMLPKSRQTPREGSTGACGGTHVSAGGFGLSSEVHALAHWPWS